MHPGRLPLGSLCWSFAWITLLGMGGWWVGGAVLVFIKYDEMDLAMGEHIWKVIQLSPEGPVWMEMFIHGIFKPMHIGTMKGNYSFFFASITTWFLCQWVIFINYFFCFLVEKHYFRDDLSMSKSLFCNNYWVPNMCVHALKEHSSGICANLFCNGGDAGWVVSRAVWGNASWRKVDTRWSECGRAAVCYFQSS